MNVNHQTLKPPIKYPGGKRFLIPRLKEYWIKSKAKRLVEPFSGGLSVALGIEPNDALLNDSNAHVINFYNWVQKGLIIDMPMEYEKDFYYQKREEFNQLISENKITTKKAASLFYYLNRTGFNGLVRFNKSGFYNVPFGKYSKINYKNNFKEYKSIMQTWEFTSNDFSSITVNKNDFLYADPPYDVEFKSYSMGGFDWEDQQRLIEWLSDKKNPIVISNQATKRVTKLYKESGYKLRYISAPRMISCNGDRTPAKEVIATKNF